MKYLKHLLFVLAFFIMPYVSSAASLSVSPSTGTYKVSDTFSAYIIVNSQGQAINAVSVKLSYPTSLLKVVSVSKTDSIINYWVQEPTFSNSNGQVFLEGVVVNPGFSGSNGKVLKVTFEAKASGVAQLNYVLSSVLANDGLGTNVLNSSSKASYTIGDTAPVSTTPGSSATPAPIFVTSSTHPDPNEWYNVRDLQLNWKIPSIVTSISYDLDQTVSTNPGSTADQKVTTYSKNNLNDGTWFFHLRARNETGWGAVSHFRVQVDTTPPQYVSVVSEGEKEGKTIFKISAKDSTSGIKNYEVRIDGGDAIFVPGSDTATFTAPILVVGEHTIFVTAYDFAGNHIANSIEFQSTGLVPPKLIEYPNELKSSEYLKVTGLSAPNHDVILTLVRQSQKKGITEEIYYFSKGTKVDLPVEKKLVRTGPDGVFRYTWEKKFLAGSYRLYAIAVDKEGNESAPSEQVTFDVLESKLFKALSYITGILSVVVPFIGILLFIIFMLLYTRKKYKTLKEEISEELDKAEVEVEGNFQRAEETTHMLENIHHSGVKPKAEVLILKEHEEDIDRVENSVRKRILNLRNKLMGK